MVLCIELGSAVIQNMQNFDYDLESCYHMLCTSRLKVHVHAILYVFVT